MKGLLRMHYYIIGGWKMLLFLVTLLFLISFFFMSHTIYLIFMQAVIVGMPIGVTPNALYYAAAQSRWHTYIRTLPLTRTQFVDDQYTFSLLSAGFAGLLAAFTASVRLMRTADTLDALPFAPSGAEITLMCTANAVTMVLMMAAVIHLLHFQRKRKRNTVTYLIALTFGLLFFFMYSTSFVHFSQALVRCEIAPFSPFTRLLPYLMTAVSAVCFALSWLYTRRAYRRRRRKKVTA